MKRGASIGLALLAALTAAAQSWPAKNVSAISRSGQFVIRGVEPDAARPFIPGVATNAALVKLDPPLVAVSCERIKQALLGTLTVPDQWRGKILVTLHPTRRADEELVVASARLGDVWQYEVLLPDRVDPDRFIRALTQVLLVEMANRQGPPQSAELPAWLAEGLPQLLIANSDVDLVLKPAPATLDGQPATLRQMREGRHLSPFAKARERLRQRPPLTLEQLGRPTPEQRAGDGAALFRDNAMLLINELLHLPNGGACLAALLPELPWDPDWRTGFLKAFKQHFKRAVDFEKWWTLQSAYFAGRDPYQTWPRAETLAKLDEVLHTPFEVRLGSNEPPMFTDVSLQAILKGWKPDRLLPVLKDKITVLDSLLLRTAPELRPLAAQYRDVLASYHDHLGRAPAKLSFTPGRHPFSAWMQNREAPPPDDALLKETLMQLEALDGRRAAWKEVPATAAEPVR
jgi:hypothetical protein